MTETEQKTEARGMPVWQMISSVLLAVAVGLCIIISAQIMAKGYVNLAGFSMFRVVTGSMEPEIPTGAALICHKTALADIRRGDIICYRTEVSDIKGEIVTHRVVDIVMDEDGSIALETQGDANITPDPYLVREENLVGRVIWYTGKGSLFNNVLSFLSGKIGFFACIVFPVLLAAGLILQNSVNNLYKEIARVQAELRRAEQEAPEEDKPLEGYATLTQRDYDEILETVRSQLLKELTGHEDSGHTETTEERSE